jgi:membrane protease YdiL (CAAX protease family)
VKAAVATGEPTRAVLIEQVVLWIATLVAIRAVVAISAFTHEVVLALVPVLFMWAPVWACRFRGVDPDDYPIALPAFSPRDPWMDAARFAGALIAVVFVPFVLLYHLWQTTVFGFEFEGTPPSQPLMLIGYHLFFVAIPEEMFYRGYMQSRLDEVWPTRWKVLGVMMGPGWLVTCVLFAFGHSIVQVQWWHFAIIIPSLAFGWLRSRTGQVLAGAFFHAWCNVTVAWLDTLYGVIPP